MANYGYHDLTRFGWSEGVHKAPTGYGHPWLVVTAGGTLGAWSRDEARKLWRSCRGLSAEEMATICYAASH